MQSQKRAAIVFAATLALLQGCSGRPARVAVPDFDPDQIGTEGIATYDDDKDGTLSAAELGDVKSLESAMSRLDTNGDKKLSAKELGARIQFYHDYKAALVPAYCTIVRGGRPVVDAEVTYEPEKFMGDHALPAYGVTNTSGSAMISIAEEHRQSPAHRGVQPGFYRIRVKLANGKEVTNLNAGAEVAGDDMNNHTFALP